ncbi:MULTISPECIES: lipoprotein insertase outer membrane protein LolB [Methylomonas]|uniref:lipoprotein insertase outer membrane protein LolB n=1 Tax=Methylomonas TaxID=416 RepID=UPI001680158C|nr:lipoprotein insertase outer membrane protein LolB [Methylomonas rhizoryzae]
MSASRGGLLSEFAGISERHENWVFQGRLAVADDQDSASMSIEWQHNGNKDQIDLSGPLSQGRVILIVTPEQVIVDDGESRTTYDGSPENVMREQFGMEIPVDSLRYWVLGGADPNLQAVSQEGGFYQAGWLVRYSELQAVSSGALPRKISAVRDKTRIKLVIDQWNLL